MQSKHQHIKIHTDVKFRHALLTYLVYLFHFAASIVHADDQLLRESSFLVPGSIKHAHPMYLHDDRNQLQEKTNSHYLNTLNTNNLLSTPDYCPGGITSTLNNKCYWDKGSNADWVTCETYCNGLGRNMICIDSFVTQSFIVNTYAVYQSFWLGLNDRASEGTFVWSGGCTSSYRKWGPSEPLGGTGENCIVFGFGGMGDWPCTTSTSCICESTWTFAPTINPSATPSAFPSKHPTVSPTCQPTPQPTSQPSSQPSAQPSRQPTNQPTSQSSRQPSAQPTRQPTLQPTSQPSAQPTLQPSAQPTITPTSQPSMQPSARPSDQPSSQPSRGPSAQPTAFPSAEPTSRPSNQPTAVPSAQPSSQPSGQPSLQPTVQPSAQPSLQPSMQPSSSPSSQPSGGPTSQPTGQPTLQPSGQPSVQPTGQPIGQPTFVPSTQPSACPSTQPSGTPSSKPSTQPTLQPSVQPNTQPISPPTGQPSMRPTVQPSSQPSNQPSSEPTAQPTIQPSAQPLGLPSIPPSTQPTMQPSMQPTRQPSQQPYARPSSQPTGAPSEQPTREWYVSLPSESPYGALSTVGDFLWACNNAGQCDVIDAATGATQGQYTFFSNVHYLQSIDTIGKLIISSRSSDEQSETLHCSSSADVDLTCEAIIFSDTSFTATSYVPFPNRITLVGQYGPLATAAVHDANDLTAQGYGYAFHNVQSVVLSHVQSPPNFIGSFVTGTGQQSAGSQVNYLIFGRLRVDSGALTAMSLSPVSGSILNSAELVNAMALEYTQPDVFIAGGMQLSDNAGVNGYVLRVNGFFGTVVYCVRYRVRVGTIGTTGSDRRVMSGSALYTSVIKDVVRVDNAMYMIADVMCGAACPYNGTSVSVLHADATTGAIVKQVSIAAPNGSFACTHITTSGDYLALLCALQRSANSSVWNSVVLSLSRVLSVRSLPTNFITRQDTILEEEYVPFVSRGLSVMTTKKEVQTARYAFTRPPTLVPTQQPSRLPTQTPSTQPSSSPSAPPSVSPQPSSQPSSSGPTNTYKPTVWPTPSTAPSTAPTVSPTTCPSAMPTTRPSDAPSLQPSTSPSAVIAISPTHTPFARTTHAPTRMPSRASTSGPSVPPTRATARAANSGLPGNKLSNIIVGCVGGLAVVLWVAYCIYRIVQYCKWIVHKDKRRVLFMQASDAPAELEHPILQRVVGCLVINEPPVLDQEVNTVLCPQKGSRKDTSATIAPVTLPHQGYMRGAYMVSPEGFVDLEANTPRDNATRRGEKETSERNLMSEQPSNDVANKHSEGHTMRPAASHEDAAQHSRKSVQSEDSESESENDESRSEKSSSSSESASASSAESYFSSDRSNVLYSLSSDQESDLDGSLKEPNSTSGSSGNESDSHNNTEL